jgi:hypothetical protein
MSDPSSFTRQIPGWGHIPGDHVSWPHTDHFGRSCGSIETLHPNDGKPIARVVVHTVTHEPTCPHEVHYLKTLKREPAIAEGRTAHHHQ